MVANMKTIAIAYGADQDNWAANTRAVSQVPGMIEVLKFIAHTYPDEPRLKMIHQILDIIAGKIDPSKLNAQTPTHQPLNCPHGARYWYPFQCRDCIRQGINMLPEGIITRTTHEEPRPDEHLRPPRIKHY